MAEELEDILRQIVFVAPTKPKESGATWPLYPEGDDFPRIVEAIQELLKQAEQKGKDKARLGGYTYQYLVKQKEQEYQRGYDKGFKDGHYKGKFEAGLDYINGSIKRGGKDGQSN